MSKQTKRRPCMLFGYAVGESRHTSGWPNRLEKFCGKTGRSQTVSFTFLTIN